MQFNQPEQEIIQKLLPTFALLCVHNAHARIMSFSELKRTLSSREKKFLREFLKINPRNYGVILPKYGIHLVPRDLVMIRKESAPGTKRIITRGVHYLPDETYRAYRAMNRAMLRDIGKRVFVESGYRSSAYQLVLFLEYLTEDGFDLRKTAKRIAFPGYSEHGAPHAQAIDLITAKREENTVKDPVFEKTKEYEWLLLYAKEYGFTLSYPRGNKWGIAFEPWHWRYAKRTPGHT